MYSQCSEGRCPCVKSPNRQRGFPKYDDVEIPLSPYAIISFKVFSLLASIYCLDIYFHQVAAGDLMHVVFLAYYILILRSVVSFTVLCKYLLTIFIREYFIQSLNIIPNSQSLRYLSREPFSKNCQIMLD
nr:unnamed protein product [Callosobruchus chinensis]